MKKKKVELTKKLAFDKQFIAVLSKKHEQNIVGGATVNDTFPCFCTEQSKVISCFPSECLNC